MALIKCIECDKEISDKASACVHCGCPTEITVKTEIEDDKNNLPIESETEIEVELTESDPIVEIEESISESSECTAEEKGESVKPKNRKPLIIGVAVFLLVAVISIAFWYFMIKVPYDKAVEEHNLSIIAIEEKYQELNNSIASLYSLVSVDNIQIEETLISDANSMLTDARNAIKDFTHINFEIPSKTIGINSATSEIMMITSNLLETALSYDMYIQQLKNKSISIFEDAVERCVSVIVELEGRNQELDDSIALLHSTVMVANLPFDETLLAVPKSILEEARSVEKDDVPVIPNMPAEINAINVMTLEIVNLTSVVASMGNYREIITKLQETYLEFETLIQQFQGANIEILWVDVDESATLLRFLTRITNSNSYTLSGVTTQWVAYSENDAIVGSLNSDRPFIPANGYVYYIGGAGGAILSGNPNRVEVTVVDEGILTNRTAPVISVSDINITRSGFSYTVTAECITDTEIEANNLSGNIILRDEDGHIIYADFWLASNLPDLLPENGKFVLSEFFWRLPSSPASAEVYVYYRG